MCLLASHLHRRMVDRLSGVDCSEVEELNLTCRPDEKTQTYIGLLVGGQGVGRDAGWRKACLVAPAGCLLIGTACLTMSGGCAWAGSTDTYTTVGKAVDSGRIWTLHEAVQKQCFPNQLATLHTMP